MVDPVVDAVEHTVLLRVSLRENVTDTVAVIDPDVDSVELTEAVADVDVDCVMLVVSESEYAVICASTVSLTNVADARRTIIKRILNDETYSISIQTPNDT